MNPIQKITSKRWSGLLDTSRKTRIVGAGALALALCAFGAVASPRSPRTQPTSRSSPIAENLALPNLADQIAALQQDEQQFIHEERVRSGDSLGSVLQPSRREDRRRRTSSARQARPPPSCR
jgi:hypothetical protein